MFLVTLVLTQRYSSAGATHSLITDTIHAFIATHPSSTSTPSSHHASPFTPEQTPTQDVVRDFFKYRVADVGRLLVFMVDYLGRLGGTGLGGIGALKEIGRAVVVSCLHHSFVGLNCV